eukprot:CAMPEP_0196720278 /NCGR_PEP_ID=MMETSP1091-20130531/3098_1 /TAXON_ID=302021 /ORGANISM="Rhodomonas sp., Strain CCMP768" /LENGTH=167 /DNA_ID=CAMNT_0042061451 /DNA_START=12 /DNA_END=515 /DNA_ORIENTATION=+
MKNTLVPIALFVLGAVLQAHAAPILAAPHVSDAVVTNSKSVQTTIVAGVEKGLEASVGAPPGTTHYGDPYTEDCLSNEVNITIVGVTGAMCSPSCAMLDSCPKDVPKGVIAKPTCALQDMAGHKYCALVCALKAPTTDYEQGLADAQCGMSASCKAIGTVGICTYDE